MAEGQRNSEPLFVLGFLQFQLTVNVVAVIVAFVGACAIEDSPLKVGHVELYHFVFPSFFHLSIPSLHVLAKL